MDEIVDLILVKKYKKHDIHVGFQKDWYICRESCKKLGKNREHIAQNREEELNEEVSY